ncbi:MAG: phosphate ABC transporter ATP-binding protein PstB [Spirochaetia bacterium]
MIDNVKEKRQHTDDYVLAIQKLNFYYGDFKALKDIDMEISRNRITAFIGPSGCGKSTMLRCINRMNDLIEGTEVDGQILLNGRNIYDKEIDPVKLRRKVGMVFQRPNPLPKSIFDNVAYGPKMYGLHNKSRLKDIVVDSLKRAALYDEVEDKLHKNALELSGGQQQRLCIARAIAVQPEIILMDEPASALDPVATMKIEALMLELAQEYTIIIVTHNMQQAARVSDYTAFFMVDENRSGYMVEYQPTQELFLAPKNKKTEEYISGRFG